MTAQHRQRAAVRTDVQQPRERTLVRPDDGYQLPEIKSAFARRDLSVPIILAIFFIDWVINWIAWGVSQTSRVLRCPWW